MRRSDSGLRTQGFAPPLLNGERVVALTKIQEFPVIPFLLYLYSDKKEVKFQTGQKKNKKKVSGPVLMEY